MVLYFSGTGNSKHIADNIAGALGNTMYSINDGIKQGQHPKIADDTVIIVVPTHGWRIPRVVSDWIMAGAAEFSGKKAYFLLNCGSEIGNAEKYAKKLCSGCGLTFMGCAEILMPENYIAMFDCPSVEEALRIVENADSRTAELAELIRSGKPIPAKESTLLDKMKSGIVNSAFYAFCVSGKKFYSKDSCIGCGKCAQLCPVNCISIQDGRPIWGDNCIHCMACICNCPTEAIEYGTISQGKRRYRCPE